MKKLITILGALTLVTVVLILPIVYVSLNYTLNNNFAHKDDLPQFESKVFDKEPNDTVKIPIQSEQIIGMSIFRSNSSFIRFNINKTPGNSYITEDELKKLGISFFDAHYFFQRTKEGKLQLEKYITLPMLIVKDIDEKDLIFKNINLTVDKKRNELGGDFLNLFDYSINYNEGQLKLKLYSEEKNLLPNENIPTITKEYMRRVIREIRRKWILATQSIPVDLLRDLTLSQKPITNECEIKIDSQRGYILSAVFLEPSSNVQFNEFCKSFIKGLERFVNIPSELKQNKSFSVTVNFTINP